MYTAYYNLSINEFTSQLKINLHNIKRAGPALTIARPYAKRIVWGPIWIGIRIITISVINVGPLEVLGPLRPHKLNALYIMEKKEEDEEGL